MVRRRSEGRSIPMSRTDAHRPFWVLLQDPTIRHWFEDIHDHIDGKCNLDQFLQTCRWMSRHQCYRNTTGAQPSLCSCDMCSGDVLGAAGKLRAHWRSARQQLLKTRFEDLDDEIDWGYHVVPRGFISRRMLRGQYYIMTSRTRRGGNTTPVE